MKIDRVVYKSQPSLLIGILTQHGVSKEWTDQHLINLKANLVFQYEDCMARFYHLPLMHEIIPPCPYQKIYWINPNIPEIPFHFKKEEVLLWLAAFRLLSKRYPSFRF